MPRGRHRHSPPLHRLLPPSAIAGVSVACAFGPWVFSETVVLRGVSAAAAVTAAVGAVVMRRWDLQAGKRVADLTRARAGDEWRHEERVAELETDLEESRELRGKLEQRLRAKRTELAGLRNEHAALLRRYATAEAERASALEGRRLLAIEAATPARALPPAAPAGAPAAVPAQAAVPADADRGEAAREKPAVPGVFSAEGARLFELAHEALTRLTPERSQVPDASETSAEADADAEENGNGSPRGGGGVPKGREDARAGDAESAAREAGAVLEQPEASGAQEGEAAHTMTARVPQASNSSGHFTVAAAVAVAPQAPVRRSPTGGGFDFFGTSANSVTSAKMPASERREALESVQNEDLADVVGHEALALHEAGAEGHIRPGDESTREVAGEVRKARNARGVNEAGDVLTIDLTAHDETEQLDVQGLRSAAS